MRTIYLDHAASTPIRKRALETLIESYSFDFANPSAAHRPGRKLMERIEECRSFFLEALEVPLKTTSNQEEHQFIFTSSASESNNFILQNLVRPLMPHDTVLFSTADHPSLTSPLQSPQSLPGHKFRLEEIPLTSSGNIIQNELEELLHLRPALLVLSHINNHSGNLHPVEKIGSMVKSLSPLTHFHVDASQSFGKVPLSLKNKAIDSVSLSAHKMGGPRGVAGLYFKNTQASSAPQMMPLIFGGGQERGFRSSTVTAPLIFSWTQAAKEAFGELSNPAVKARIQLLNQNLRESLVQKIPEIKFPFISEVETSPFICTLLLPGIPSDIILRHLEELNIYLSSSAACSSRVKGENPVFQALHIPPNLHKNVLRISFSPMTTVEELAHFSEALVSVYFSLATLSPSRRTNR